MYSGLVTARVVDWGSKSERTAVVLEMGDRSFVLRRLDGNPFADPVLDRLVGQRLSFDGVPHGNVLIVSSWKAL